MSTTQRLVKICTVGLLLLTLLVPSLTWSEQAKPRKRTVAVMPVMNYIRTPQSLWKQTGQTPAKKRTEDVIESYLVRRLRVEPTLNVVSPKALADRIRRIPTNSEKTDLGLSRMELGMEFFKSLHVNKAIPHLKQAYASLEDAYFGLVQPQKMAQLLLTLGQCHLEKNEEHEAHVMLKRVFFRQPTIQFQKGFFSGAFEQALMSSLVDFVATYPKENPLHSMAALERFVNDINVDSLIYAYIASTSSGPQVHIQVYDRHTRNISYRASLASTGSADDLERVDRFVSRWATCLPPSIEGPKKKKKRVSRFFIDTSFAYSVFLQNPTRRYFHNLGMGIAGEWQFTNSLGVFSEIAMLTSIQDPDRDLLDQVSSIRFVAGLSFAISRKWWRLFARLGFDVHIPGAFTITKDPSCKFYGIGDKQCTGEVFNLGGETTMGPIASLGAQFFVGRDLYLTTRLSASTYVIPLDRSAALNHPFGLETGIGYTF